MYYTRTPVSVLWKLRKGGFHLWALRFHHCGHKRPHGTTSMKRKWSWRWVCPPWPPDGGRRLAQESAAPIHSKRVGVRCKCAAVMALVAEATEQRETDWNNAILCAGQTTCTCCQKMHMQCGTAHEHHHHCTSLKKDEHRFSNKWRDYVHAIFGPLLCQLPCLSCKSHSSDTNIVEEWICRFGSSYPNNGARPWINDPKPLVLTSRC